MFKKRQAFIADCPYCDSSFRIKAGHKLKFKTYYFENASNREELYKYKSIATWKCPFCRQKFAVDMIHKKTYTLNKIPEMGAFYDRVSLEEFYGDI